MARTKQDMINEIIAYFDFEEVQNYRHKLGEGNFNPEDKTLGSLRESAREVLSDVLDLDNLSTYYSGQGVYTDQSVGFLAIVTFKPNKKKKITMDDIINLELHYSIAAASADEDVWY